MAEFQQPLPASDAAVAFSIERSTSRTSPECPGSPQSFKTTEQPNVEVGLRTRGEQIDPDIYECVLTITLTGEDQRPHALSRRGFTGRHFHHPRHPARASAAGDCDQLSERALPLSSGNACRRGGPRRITDGAPCTDQLRGALPAAAGANGATGAGGRRCELGPPRVK